MLENRSSSITKENLLAKHPSKSEDGIIEVEIPIAAFRKGRKIPINHLNMKKENLPQTDLEMKERFDKESRFLNAEKIRAPIMTVFN